MADWNFNMSEAPKGHTEKRSFSVRDREVTKDVHVPELIIAADPDSDVVTVSRWIPKEDRWNMFSKNRPPLAWKPFPKHPRSPETGEDG